MNHTLCGQHHALNPIIAKNIALALAYWGVSHLNVLVFQQLGVLPMAVWPAAAIALLAFLDCGWRVAPGIAVGTFLANYFSLNSPLLYAGLIPIMNTLGPLIVATAIRRHLGGLHLRRFSDFLIVFVLAVVLAPALTATGGIGFKWALGLIPTEAVSGAWVKWALAHATGTLIFGAPMLAYLMTQEAAE